MMAAQMKLKLPSLRVTQRSTTDEVVHRLIPRGCTSQCEKYDEEPSLDSVSNDGDSVTEFDGMDEFDTSSPNPNLTIPVDEPSLHLLAQKAAVASWKMMRPAILRVAIESNAMPPNQVCIRCGTDEATYRCLRCAPWAHFCSQCFGDTHRETNLFHTGEVWEVGSSR